jgi:hypothetical protein
MEESVVTSQKREEPIRKAVADITLQMHADYTLLEWPSGVIGEVQASAE